MEKPSSIDDLHNAQPPTFLHILFEVALIVVLFFVYAGAIPPDVNEAHYLTKAKHYWDPAWCTGDRFLESSDAHLVFYWTFGWLTRFFSLATTAWIGRITVWTLLATSWWRLCHAIVGRRWSALLSAALMLMLLDRFHMAGEWIVGGLEAKCVAYAFILLALEQLVRGKWFCVWVPLGLATAFHVLVGGWAMLGVAVVWLFEPRADRSSWKAMAAGILAAGVLALPGLLPALSLFQGVDDQTRDMGNEIYVFERLSHHLVAQKMVTTQLVRWSGLTATWLLCWWWCGCDKGARRVQRMVLVAVLAAAVGYVIGQITWVSWRNKTLTSALLRYYWFRQSDVMVPIGLSLLVTTWLVRGDKRVGEATRRTLIVVSLVAVSSCYGFRWWTRQNDATPPAVVQETRQGDDNGGGAMQAFNDWRDLCLWVRDTTPSSSVFLTPQFRQTFKWYAQRPEVVTWKDVPQDARGLVDWWYRMRDVDRLGLYRSNGAATTDKLEAISNRYGIDYVVVDRVRNDFQAPWPLVYRNGSFTLYRVPPN